MMVNNEISKDVRRLHEMVNTEELEGIMLMNDHLRKGVYLANRAVESDRSGNEEEAKSLYERAATLFLQAVQTETNPSVREVVLKVVDEYMSMADRFHKKQRCSMIAYNTLKKVETELKNNGSKTYPPSPLEKNPELRSPMPRLQIQKVEEQVTASEMIEKIITPRIVALMEDRKAPNPRLSLEVLSKEHRRQLQQQLHQYQLQQQSSSEILQDPPWEPPLQTRQQSLPQIFEVLPEQRGPRKQDMFEERKGGGTEQLEERRAPQEERKKKQFEFFETIGKETRKEKEPVANEVIGERKPEERRKKKDEFLEVPDSGKKETRKDAKKNLDELEEKPKSKRTSDHEPTERRKEKKDPFDLETIEKKKDSLELESIEQRKSPDSTDVDENKEVLEPEKREMFEDIENYEGNDPELEDLERRKDKPFLERIVRLARSSTTSEAFKKKGKSKPAAETIKK
eukprot:TRINITY_DN4855_c1_g2_i2.p1 TRINITY_DN4855_c1_g2~~TRINITY_DN4855_c1_g2_i2.p1  ORF type:complete len:456 (-),score=107.06 TRINITY_DN4855_c1_g2_i2:305-1672(-)